MKNLGPLLAGGLTLLIVLGVGIFSFLPAERPTQATTEQPVAAVPIPPTEQIAVPAEPDTTQFDAAMAEREAIYQAQIEELNQASQERQATYQAQIEASTVQIASAQNQLNDLKAQEQNLLAQVSQLETARAERLAVYQNQLQQVQKQYSDRYVQLQAQLNEARAKLSEANVQLGR